MGFRLEDHITYFGGIHAFRLRLFLPSDARLAQTAASHGLRFRRVSSGFSSRHTTPSGAAALTESADRQAVGQVSFDDMAGTPQANGDVMSWHGQRRPAFAELKAVDGLVGVTEQVARPV